MPGTIRGKVPNRFRGGVVDSPFAVKDVDHSILHIAHSPDLLQEPLVLREARLLECRIHRLGSHSGLLDNSATDALFADLSSCGSFPGMSYEQ